MAEKSNDESLALLKRAEKLELDEVKKQQKDEKQRFAAQYKEARAQQQISEKTRASEVEHRIDQAVRFGKQRAAEAQRNLWEAEDALHNEWKYEAWKTNFEKGQRKEDERIMRGALKTETIENRRQLQIKYRQIPDPALVANSAGTATSTSVMQDEDCGAPAGFSRNQTQCTKMCCIV